VSEHQNPAVATPGLGGVLHFLSLLPALMHDPCALAQRDRRRRPTCHGLAPRGRPGGSPQRATGGRSGQLSTARRVSPKWHGRRTSCARLRLAWVSTWSRFTAIVVSAAPAAATSGPHSIGCAVTPRDGNSIWSWRGRSIGSVAACKTWSPSSLSYTRSRSTYSCINRGWTRRRRRARRCFRCSASLPSSSAQSSWNGCARAWRAPQVKPPSNAVFIFGSVEDIT
jgi:hypothetical protein